MQYQIDRQEESLLVIIKDLTVDLSFISTELDDQYRHLILDLSEFSEVSQEKLKNFINFGKNVVKKFFCNNLSNGVFGRFSDCSYASRSF